MKKFVKIISKRKRISFSIILGIILFSGYFIYQYFYQIMPQPTIFFLNDVEIPNTDENVVFFSPHPDDEAISAGGYIESLNEHGVNVYIVLVTDGNKHGLKDKRYAEFKEVTLDLGIPSQNLIYLDYPDGSLNKIDKKELINKFYEILIQCNPRIILFPHSQDGHSDHSITGQLVTESLKLYNKNPISYAYLVHHPNFPEPKKYSPELYLLPPQGLIQFDQEWKRYILTENQKINKKKALEQYKSQINTPFLRSLIYASIRKNEIFAEIKIK